MIRTYAPGKLFIAGEYAVVEPGYPAILVGVDRFIEVALEKSLNQGSITSYGRKAISWVRKNGKVILSQQDNHFSYILSAINMVETYAKEHGKELDLYHLNISSQLETNDGRKYGLGSSAGVTVATVEALCKHYGMTISNMELFKLSALANLAINRNGSCGDIAASVYGGWIAFTTFDRDWVLEQRKDSTITQLLNIKWPGLSIETLTPPKGLELVVGWTGKPASTTSLVERVNEGRIENSTFYRNFLYHSKKCVIKMINAFKEGNPWEIQKQIQINRALLVDMSKELDLVIETPLLTKLCDIALKFKGSGKSSGAGGGDCGIAIFQDNKYLTQLVDEWKKVGITYIPLKVYNPTNKNKGVN